MEHFKDYSPIQLSTIRNTIHDMMIESGGYHSEERIQHIAEMFQYSSDEVRWLLGYK